MSFDDDPRDDDAPRPDLFLQALLHDAVWIERTDRTRIAFTGADRAKSLHNLTTQNINALKPGQGAEGFVTTPQGKTLALVTVHVDERDPILWVRSDAGVAGSVSSHFSKYCALDETTWTDHSASTTEFLILGPRAEEILERVGLRSTAGGSWAELMASPEGAIRNATLEGLAEVADPALSLPPRLIRERFGAHHGVTILTGLREAVTIRSRLAERAECAPMPPAKLEALRIEIGLPRFGVDLTADHLPQEFDRDARAISFTKGCYLGQETVARLDALGHVNKMLRHLKFHSVNAPLPPSGTTLMKDDRPVGTLTSVARLVDGSGVLGLGMVRIKQAPPGSTVVLTLDRPGGPSTWAMDILPLPRFDSLHPLDSQDEVTSGDSKVSNDA